MKISNFLENDSGRESCHVETVASRARRGGCTTVLLTMKKKFLEMSAEGACEVNNCCGAHIEVYRNGIEV